MELEPRAQVFISRSLDKSLFHSSFEHCSGTLFLFFFFFLEPSWISWKQQMFLFTQSTGPYTIIVGTPSKIEDVIQYADFTQKVSAVELVDDTTLDEEPNLDDLYGLTNGNIQLNNTDLHVLPAGEFQIC